MKIFPQPQKSLIFSCKEALYWSCVSNEIDSSEEKIVELFICLYLFKAEPVKGVWGRGFRFRFRSSLENKLAAGSQAGGKEGRKEGNSNKGRR